MLTIYKTLTMKDASTQVMQLLKRVDHKNLSVMHTIIVPDRSSMETERLLLKTIGGSFNVQVLTFRRLASKILPKLDYLSKQAGIMALTGIIQENRDKLVCYTKGVDTAGFVSDMYDTISMMKYCKISPEKLLVEDMPKGVKAKAQDIALLYNAYLEFTSHRFVDSADKLDLLCQELPSSQMVRDGYFYLFDFDNLSAQELAIVEQLVLCSRGVTVGCCVSEKQQDKYLYLNDIFDGVLQVCAKNDVTPNIVECQHNTANKQLQHIGKNLYRYTSPTQIENDAFVELFQGETRHKEVYALACRIQKYVRDGGRFKDVYVVTSDIQKYTNSISSVFDELDIPYFCDKQFALSDQPYARLVLDYLALYKNNGRLQNVLNFVKNYLFCGNFDTGDDWENAVYKFENYCLKYNVSYQYDNFALGKTEEIFASANAFRQKFNNLYKQVEVPTVASVNAYVDVVRALLQANNTSAKNNLFAERQNAFGYVAEANATLQAEEKFEQVLAQAEEILGSRIVKLDDFAKILTTAVASVKISVLPQTNDCVVFANMAKARKHDIKFLALLGANYGAMPIVKKDSKLLSDKNIQDLISVGINVEPQIFTENKREKFSLFQLLQEPTQHLYVSYATTDGADTLSPSAFVGELRNLFTHKGKPLTVREEDDEEIYTESQAISKVILNKRRLADKQLVKMPAFDILQRHFCDQMQKYQFSKDGRAVRIDNGNKLYFKSERTSVSQLTEFYNCPYKFFVEYGLNVKPREIAELKPADLGNILHEVMEKYVAILQKGESDDVTKQKANKCFDNALDNDFYRAIKTDVKMQGALDQLRAESIRMCLVVKDQLSHSKFTNLKTELEFGTENAHAPAVTVDYGGGKFNLVGKIDRVDGYENHLMILDYKSGAVASQYSEKDLYIGHKMQLLVYLRAAQDFYKMRPAGFYYFNMHNNFTDAKTDKVYSYNGRTLDNVDVACALDDKLQSGFSEKLSLRLKNNGELSKVGGRLLTAEQFESQVDYASALIKRAGQLMQQGYAAVNPYDGACAFCDYKSVCDFGDVYTYYPRKVTEKITASTIENVMATGVDDDE